MNIFRRRKTRLFLALAIAVSFSVASLFGASLMMDMDENGQMQDCPLMAGQSQMCDMNIATHLSSWRQMFYATFEKSDLMMLLSVLALIFAGFFSLKFFRDSNALKTIPIRLDRIRNKRTSDNFGNYIFEVIGSGIVHKRE